MLLNLLLAASLTLQLPGSTWVCPMHPDVRAEEPGKCPRCGMALTAFKADTHESFVLDVTREDGPAVAGRPFTLGLRVSHPRTKEGVSDFLVVHEKPAHMFVVSSDLQVFEHVHPTVSDEGHLSLTWTAPRAGRYHFLLDVVPAGALPQLLEAVVVVDGDQPATALVTPTKSSERDGIRATIESNIEMAGNWSYLTFRLTDAATGEALTGWETWLGAWAHLFAVREGATEPVHSHPDEGVEVRSTAETNITLEVLFPRPGRYGVWLQLQRNGKVTTLPFFVDVAGWTSGREN
ncbi:MAG: hypothetical protein LC791_17240 [Acidobacteria bacterium]|nr:hypothetical protein [Acidobacteriota bacterium]